MIVNITCYFVFIFQGQISSLSYRAAIFTFVARDCARGIRKMAAPVRRRTDLTLKDKYKIACYIDDHPEETQKDISAQFSIPKSTMSRLASNVSQIKRAYHENTRLVTKYLLRD